MDVAIITDEISQDLAESLEVMRRCSVDQAEIRAVWGTNCVDLADDDIRRARKMLDDAGMTVCCLASPFFKCDLDENARASRGMMHQAKDLTMADQPALLERCFRVAEMLGTRNIRVFSFWRKSDPTDAVYERIVEAFAQPLQKAEKEGFRLLLENEHACFLGTGEETARVLNRIQSPALGLVWDPGNAFCAGETAFPDGYRHVRGKIDHIHIKDAIRHNDGKVEFVRVGTGSIGFQEHIDALKADGYNGLLSLETHYALAEGGKLAASEESMIALAKMVRGN